MNRLIAQPAGHAIKVIMTRQDFEKARTGIVQKGFSGDFADPLQYGIQRGNFERDKLQKLIELGKNVPSKTVKDKVERWKKQVEKIDARVTELQKLKDEIRASRVRIGLPGSQQAAPREPTRRPRFE